MTIDESWKQDQWADLQSPAFAEGWKQMLDKLFIYSSSNLQKTLAIPGLVAKKQENAENLINAAEKQAHFPKEALDMLKHIAYQCHANPLEAIREEWQKRIPELRNINSEQIGEASFLTGLRHASMSKGEEMQNGMGFN